MLLFYVEVWIWRLLVGVLLGFMPSHVGHHKAEGPVLQEVSTRSQVYEVLFYQFGYILVAFVSGSQLGF